MVECNQVLDFNPETVLRSFSHSLRVLWLWSRRKCRAWFMAGTQWIRIAKVNHPRAHLGSKEGENDIFQGATESISLEASPKFAVDDLIPAPFFRSGRGSKIFVKKKKNVKGQFSRIWVCLLSILARHRHIQHPHNLWLLLFWYACLESASVFTSSVAHPLFHSCIIFYNTVPSPQSQPCFHVPAHIFLWIVYSDFLMNGLLPSLQHILSMHH